jgi:hypothetical protein
MVMVFSATLVEEIKGLIDSLKDIYNDQIAVETAVERFTCT